MKGCYFATSKCPLRHVFIDTLAVRTIGEGPKIEREAVGHEMFDYDAEFR